MPNRSTVSRKTSGLPSDPEDDLPTAKHRVSTYQRVTELFGSSLNDHSLTSVKKLGHLQNKNARTLQKQMLMSLKHEAVASRYGDAAHDLELTEHARATCKESIKLLSVWDKHQVQLKFTKPRNVPQRATSTTTAGLPPLSSPASQGGAQVQPEGLLRPASPQRSSPVIRRRSASPALQQSGDLGQTEDGITGLTAFSAAALFSDLLEQHPGSPINDKQVKQLAKVDTRRMLNTLETVLQDSHEVPLLTHARAYATTTTRVPIEPGAPGPLSPSRQISPRHLHNLPVHGEETYSTSMRAFSPRQPSPRMRSPLATCRSRSPLFVRPSVSITRPSTGPDGSLGTDTPISPLGSVPGALSTRSSLLFLPGVDGQPTLVVQTAEQITASVEQQATIEQSNPVACATFADADVNRESEAQPRGSRSSPDIADDRGITKIAGRTVVLYSGVFPSSHTARQDALARNVPSIVHRNAAGYVEDMAAAEVAACRDATERGRTVLLQTHLLPADELRSKALRGSVQELHYRRPYFLPKASDSVQVLVGEPGVLFGLRAARKLAVTHGDDMPVAAAANTQSAPQQTQRAKAWTPEMSVFAPRMVESDAHAMNDSPSVKERQLGMDWRRIAMKDSFRHWVASLDPCIRSGTATLDKVLSHIQSKLHDHCDALRTVFCFYACAGHEEGRVSLLITQQKWKQLLSDCRVTPGVKAGPVEAIFVASCMGSSDSLPEGLEVEAHHKLMSFEFYEAVIRMATIVYPVPAQAASVADALHQLMEHDIKAHAPLAALHVASGFREQRLYTQEVDVVLRTAGPVLHALYTCACASAGSKYLHVDQWMEMLSMAGVLGEHTGLTTLTATLVAAWSQLIVVDEIHRRQRAASMDLLDMCEALARLADIVSPPTISVVHTTLRSARLLDNSQLEAAVADHPYHTYYTLADLNHSSMCFTRRRSAGLIKPRVRPLADKLSSFLDLFITGTCNSWAVPDSAHLVAKLNYVTQLMLQQGWGQAQQQQQQHS